jgi:hypothetical protein
MMKNFSTDPVGNKGKTVSRFAGSELRRRVIKRMRQLQRYRAFCAFAEAGRLRRSRNVTGPAGPVARRHLGTPAWAANQLQSLVDEAIAGNPRSAGRSCTRCRSQGRRLRWPVQTVIRCGRPLSNSTYQRYTENGVIPPPLAGSYKTDSELALNFSYDFDFWGRHAAEFRSAISQDKAAQAEQYNARLGDRHIGSAYLDTAGTPVCAA